MQWTAFTILAVVALPAGAFADELRATRDQPLTETRHTVDITLRNGVATYVVRRSFKNRGKVAEEGLLDIALPYGAVATGLRIKSGSRWYAGDLMHRDKAEELYRELTGLGPSEPKDPALLYWQWTDQLALRVFPIFPGKVSTVEYTLTVPTSYRDGTYYVSYGREPDAKNLTTPVVRVRGKHVREVRVDGRKHKGRKISLGKRKLHPVLSAQGIDNDRVLVRSVRVGARGVAEKMTLAVEIKHTWPGDIELDLVDPHGKLHDIYDHDFSRSDNDLKRSFELDYGEVAKGTWSLLVTDHHPLDGGTLVSWSLEPSGDRVARGNKRALDTRPAFIPQPSEGDSSLATLGIALEKGRATRVRLGRVALIEDKQFSRVEIDVAETLSKLPKRQSVVFVIDASHTMEVEGIEAQLRLARAYLAHVPDARFALVGTRHEAEVWSSLRSARAFESTVDELRKAGRLAPNNGSFLDAGLAEAATLLRDVTTPSAVIAMTDDRLRPVWTNKTAIEAIDRLPQACVVHVIEVEDTGAGSTVSGIRQDKHRLFPIAKKRSGVAVSFSGSGAGKWTQLVAESEYLVRPNRLDHPALDVLKKQEIFDSETIGEGESVRWMSPVETAPSALTLSGQLWSKPVAYQAKLDEAFHRATAGFVFSLDHYGDLTEAEQFVVASYGQAVSPVTSYLAIEPGVRPSTIGIDRDAMGGLMGSGYGSGSGSGFGGGARPKIDWHKIADNIRATCKARGLTARKTRLTVDRNDHEIADVRLRSADNPFAACVVAEMWKQQLPRGMPGDKSEKLEL